MYLSRRSLLRLRVWPWSLPEPQYILYVCDDTPTQPTSPHLLLAAVWTSAAAVLPNPRHATSAPVAPVRPAPLLAITYLLTTHCHGSRAYLLP